MKTATIIPVHSPKFKDLETFIKSMQLLEVKHDLYVVFSSELEAFSFKRKGLEYKELVLPESEHGKLSVVNIKKNWALSQIYSQYDYIGVFDAETEIVKECNLDDVYYWIGNRNWVNGNWANLGGDIIKTIAKLLDIDTNDNIIRETKNYNLYWWFQDIPVYDCSKLERYFKWLNERANKNLIDNEYLCFDFLMYSMWNIAYEGWHIKEFPFHLDIGAVEQFRLDESQRLEILREMKPYWSVDRGNHHQFQNIKMIFHTDRAV